MLIGTRKFDAAVGNAMRTRVLRFRARLGVAVACPVLSLDIRIVKKICRRITADGIRKCQHIVCRRRNISSALDIHITVINLVDARRRVQRRRNRALGDVALKVQSVDSARIKLIVFLVARRARKLHQSTVDIDGLVISNIRTFRRGGCPCLTEGDGIVVGEIDRRTVAVHKAIRAQGNIPRLDSVGKLRRGIGRAVVLALDLAHIIDRSDNLALADRDVRARDIIAVLSAIEHSLAAALVVDSIIDCIGSRIAAATAGRTLGKMYERAIICAIEFKIRIINIRDGRVRTIVIFLRNLQIVGIVDTANALAVVAFLARTRDIAAVRLLVRRLHRIGGSSIVAVRMACLLEIGIGILRLHRALHKGGQKRQGMAVKNTPSLILTAVSSDVPSTVGSGRKGIFFIRAFQEFVLVCASDLIRSLHRHAQIVATCCCSSIVFQIDIAENRCSSLTSRIASP